jgi:hypothetical protein
MNARLELLLSLGPSREVSLFAVSDGAQKVNFVWKKPCPARGFRLEVERLLCGDIISKGEQDE